MRVGTSHVISLSVLDAALDVFDELDRHEVWERGTELVSHLLDGFAELGLDVITPSDPEERGVRRRSGIPRRTPSSRHSSIGASSVTSVPPTSRGSGSRRSI